MSVRVNIIKNIIYTPTYMIQKGKMDPKEVEKFEQAIEVHGYRGVSKMKHNGVVNIKPSDTHLLKSLEKFKLGDQEFLESHTKNRGEIFVANVKIVAHVPAGNRAIGLLYKNKSNDYGLYVLGFSNYNYQIF